MSSPAIEDIYPLSPLQQGILFHCLMQQDGGMYWTQFGFTLSGKLDTALLRSAWRETIARHAVLRSVFLWERRDRPLQVVMKDAEPHWTELDWSDCTQGEQQQRLHSFLEADRLAPQKLAQGPLSRYALIRLAPDRYRFVWSAHHILLDGWSLPLVLNEVLDRYDRMVAREPFAAPAVGRYKNYIEWHSKQEWTEAEKFFRPHLAGVKSPTPLGMDGIADAPEELHSGYESQRLTLNSEASETLKTFARKQRVTVNTLMQAAWGLLLHRYSSESDVLFGVTLSGRSAPVENIASTVGLVINSLPMCLRIEGSRTLSAWLQDVQKSQMSLQQFEHVPLVEAQRWSEIPRGKPLFESLLVFENYPVRAGWENRPSGIQLSEVGSRERDSYPLTLVVHAGAQIQMQIAYDCSRFSARAVERLLEHLANLLRAFEAGADERIASLKMLSQTELDLLASWSPEPAAALKTALPVHVQFEQHAARTPDALAVACGDVQLSYGELNRRSDLLAARLSALGVQTDTRVAVCLDRSAELVVSFLAILKAGGAYVPLDPDAPRTRLTHLLEDSAAHIVLTLRALHGRVPAGPWSTVCLDDPPTQGVASPAETQVAPIRADQLAYIIYTSGSSGRPKGVAVTNGNLAASTAGRQSYYRDAPQRLIATTAFTFDATTGAVWWTLCSGGTFIVPEPERAEDARYLGRLIERTRATHFVSATPIYGMLVRERAPEQWSSLRAVIVGGEALSGTLVRDHYAQLRETTLFNEYGPSEATVWATVFQTNAADADSKIPIGRPAPHTRLHVLDRFAQPLPIGVAGELCIGGPGIARGYLNLSRTNAEQFIGSPLRPGERLYRTGDLVRYRADGNLIFLGRRDSQVKLRGVRIELGEIEQCLMALAGVGRAVVILSEAPSIEPRLVAYVEPQLGGVLSDRQLKATLRNQLPAALVPSAFIVMSRLPTLASGKIDRHSLPAPERETARPPHTPPRDPIEAALCEIWREVLRVEDLGIHDNFFELGGHSLLATQAISRIRETLQAPLPLRKLFEAPTVAELAREVAKARDAHASESPETVIEILPRDRALPVSFSQRRMWFIQQMDPQATAYNMPFAIRLTGPLDKLALSDALQAIVDRHETFRTTFSLVGGEPAQIIAATGSSRVESMDLRHFPPADRSVEAARIFRDAATSPFDLEKGPLSRFLLVQLDDADHVMLWLIHHAIGDQWSAGIMFRELAALYRARVTGQPATLEPLRVQYADFAAWQRQHLGGDALADDLTYWRSKLAGLSVASLPMDRPRPARQTYRGSFVAATLAPATLTGLKRMAVRRGATPFMLLLAAFKTLIARYSGQFDVAIGAPIANRTRLATENLIGTLVNTLVMRTAFEDDPTFTDMLARVRTTALEAYAHQDVPFERLVEELAGNRDASHSPLVQVLFNVPNAPVRDIALDPIKIELFDFDHGSAQFDLALTVETQLFGRAYLAYSTDLFEHETAQRMLDNFVGLVEQIVADPEKRLSSYRLTSALERHRMVDEWNRTGGDYPQNQRTDELVTEQAARTPHATAVSMGDRRLTYAALDARANQLARVLQSRGIGAGALVGVSLERSPDMVVVLLAVMKAGAAYVPLDPAFPAERLKVTALDAGLAALITEQQLLAIFPDMPGQTLCIEDLWRECASQSTAGLEGHGSTDDLAYVLYTSGSTGRPKGVEIPHRALTNFLWSMRDKPGCAEHDTLLSVTTLSFDISGLEVYLPLIVGGRIEIASREQLSDARALIERIDSVRPTIMQATPATWRMLLDAGWSGNSALKILCGGEGLPQELATALLDRCNSLWNMYGPTETTIWSTLERIEAGAQEITIGRPIANTSVHILDKMLEPVPVGVAGELYIGGDGLARGYHNRPDLTAERFVTDPFSPVPGARLYRTGDLARYRPDGRIVHLGRLDFQVKIRGFRIEPGDVESALAAHPAIAQVVVAGKDDRRGAQQLVAYLIARGENQPGSGDLRAFANARLPAYMVPSQFIFVDEFPLTANNKIDTRGLPDPGALAIASDAPRIEPRDQLEMQLASLWTQVLGTSDISVRDNFFDLGGHSLKAVTMFAGIQQRFGVQLPLATLFQAPTIEQLARILKQSGWRPSWRLLVPIQPIGTAVPLFAVSGVGGNVLVFAKIARLLGANQPFYGLQAQGLDGIQKPFRSITAAATAYVEEIRSVQPTGPYRILGACTGGVFAYEIAQQLTARGEEVDLALVDTWHPDSYRRSSRSPGAAPLPLRFLWSKLAAYCAALARLPLREWPAFFKNKARLIPTLVDHGNADPLSEGGLQFERIVQATFEAVAAYDAKPYPGTLVNVIATKRVIPAGVFDSRRTWEGLTPGLNDIVLTEAEDSGRVFVSPHVEVLASALARRAFTPPAKQDSGMSELGKDTLTAPARAAARA
ncbi:MAG: amino acid adenylation domain-containing protein [Gammaproteobacteria bacterium]